MQLSTLEGGGIILTPALALSICDCVVNELKTIVDVFLLKNNVQLSNCRKVNIKQFM